MDALANARAEWEALDPDDRELPIAVALKQLIAAQEAIVKVATDEEALAEFLRYYTTPAGNVSTRRVSLAGDIVEWLELRLVEAEFETTEN